MISSDLFWSLATLFVSFLLYRGFKRLLARVARRKNVPDKRVFYIGKVFELLFIVTVMLGLAFIWSVDIKGVSVFASSIFAVIGVALFAQWSILSNITASIIIFFTFPARVGDKVRIIDGDDSIEGIISEITLFQIELKDEAGNAVFYPNNLLLQKPVKKLL